MLYVLDAGGTSLAASDWDQPGTTVGQDLSFRPYVIDALGQGRGRFYGVGITSRKPGYYLSYALRRGQPHARRGGRQGQPRGGRARLAQAARATCC